MRIIDTSEVNPMKLRPRERDWAYNGLDCLLTAELFEKLEPQLDEYTAETYRFAKALQGPVFEMRLRGVLVDEERRAKALEDYHVTLARLESNLARLVREVHGQTGFNWRSPKDLKELFYERMGIPARTKMGKVSVDRDKLEELEMYQCTRTTIKHLKELRDIGKMISFLETPADKDGRMRTSFNIGGTKTGRLSSSFTEFGTGTNLQNVSGKLRQVFIADPGMKLAKFDGKQGESRSVGATEWKLFNNRKYLDTCESGDLHVYVAKLVWPDLGWTGIPAADLKLSKRLYYRDLSYRDMCKKVGHGSNYGGQPPTLAREAKVTEDLVEDFQAAYFEAFPAHLQWHEWVREEIKRCGTLISLTGRKRIFWGRRDDPKVLRDAMAYDPQGSLADITNQGMLQVWHAIRRGLPVQLWLNVHDAVVIQYREEMEDEVIPKILHHLRYPIPIRDGEFVIPYDCETGWNFGEYDAETNPGGLKEYKIGDKRTRPKIVPLLDRKFC